MIRGETAFLTLTVDDTGKNQKVGDMVCLYEVYMNPWMRSEDYEDYETGREILGEITGVENEDKYEEYYVCFLN